MSLGFSLIAVKSTDTNAIMNTLADFYTDHQLGLVEERIGDRTGKYATSPSSYQDLKTYAERELKYSTGFTSNFALAENLPDNIGWTLIEYHPHFAPYTVNIHTELTARFSSTLQTIAFEYSELDTVDFYYFKS